MKKHKDSHLDHALTDAQIEFILALPAKEGSLTIQTVELPAELGTVPCALYGPMMGDAPIPESAVTYEVRGERKGKSRMLLPHPSFSAPLATYPRTFDYEPRPTRKVTVISGPHDGEPCVLFTAFGGPQAPREPFEFENVWEMEAIESQRFWDQHALSKGVGD